MKNFDELLKKYADFIVRVGVNPQPGQVLIINCALEGAPLARLCVRSAFEAGARDVQVNWTDDAVTRTRMELGSEEALTDHKGWQLRRYLDYAETEGGVCVLHLIADDPEVFAGLDGAKISRVNSANRAFMQPWREYTMNDRVQWSIAAIPSAPWAKKMFPELDTDAAIEALWQLIFDTCRVTGGDPVGEWQEHLARLSALRDKMNALDLESVHFASSNGTDLTVGIADQAVWESAASKNEKGVAFLPNIPTEEVFTAPHKDKVNGVVYGTKPYVFNGQLIKGFYVTFKDGKVVEHGAEEGADLLGQLLDQPRSGEPAKQLQPQPGAGNQPLCTQQQSQHGGNSGTDHKAFHPHLRHQPGGQGQLHPVAQNGDPGYAPLPPHTVQGSAQHRLIAAQRHDGSQRDQELPHSILVKQSPAQVTSHHRHQPHGGQRQQRHRGHGLRNIFADLLLVPQGGTVRQPVTGWWLRLQNL